MITNGDIYRMISAAIDDAAYIDEYKHDHPWITVDGSINLSTLSNEIADWLIENFYHQDDGL